MQVINNDWMKTDSYYSLIKCLKYVGSNVSKYSYTFIIKPEVLNNCDIYVLKKFFEEFVFKYKGVALSDKQLIQKCNHDVKELFMDMMLTYKNE